MISAFRLLPPVAGALAAWFYLSREKRQDKHRFRSDPARGVCCRNGPAAEAAAFLKAHPEAVILDVRSQREHASGALHGACSTPSGSEDFSLKVSALDRSVPVLVYCAGGHRSRKAVDVLRALDFKTIQHIHRGYYSWRMAGLPVEIPKKSQRFSGGGFPHPPTFSSRLFFIHHPMQTQPFSQPSGAAAPNPADSNPSPRILIVGGVAGGASTAARARRLSESAEIVLFERGPHVSFANCGLPYYVGGEIADREDLLVQTPASLKARFNLDVRVNSEVLRIDRAGHTVSVRNRLTGEEYSEPYDKLVLATGAAPVRPPIPGLERPLHFMVRNIPDVERIVAWADAATGKRVVVVGGGYIGLEMAEQLRRRGLEVTILEALPQVMAPLDPEMAAWLHAELREQGVRLCLGDGVASFDPPGVDEPAGASIVVLKSGLRLPADAVILGLGVKPEVSLAREAGLEIGSLGGIRVDDGMRSSDPDILAVGDAVEVKDGVTGNWALIPLAGPANRQGRIAADNIFGGNSGYPGTFGTAVLRLFRLTAACTGSGAKALTRAGIPFETVHLHPGSHAGYFPGAEPIALKLLFAPGSGRLLGAQAVGREGVDKRMDVLAVALKAGMTVHDLAELELCYAPPFGSAKDPVNLAGMAAQNVLAGRVRQVQWDEVAGLDPDRFLLVDVRSAEEHAKGFIPGSVFIPVNELRQRMGELPRDRELVVYCQSGLRSYIAARMLGQSGFKVRNLSGAWRTWRAATA